MTTRTVNVGSLSGGKDSAAMCALAEKMGVDLLRVFADTGNEHPLTYEYVDYLEQRLGSITRVKADFRRVGCMPCVNANKNELFEIARRFPDEIDRIREWEGIVKMASKRGAATFFPTAHGQGKGIDEWVEWSMTTHGGKNLDLLKVMAMDDVPMCSSQYGLCE